MSNKSDTKHQAILGMPFNEYRAELDYVSVSELKSYIDSPYSYHKRYIQGIKEDRPKSAALTFGTLAHCLILEPESFDAEYFVSDVRKDNRTAKYKEVLEEAGHREVISNAELDRAKECAEEARPLLLDIDPEYIAELSYFYEGPRGFLGLKAKARFDAWLPNKQAILDIKTMNKLPTYKNVQQAVVNFNYHMQVAWYMDIHKCVYGRLPKAFIFIFVQSEFPYGAAVYTVSRNLIEEGRAKYRKYLKDLREALKHKDDLKHWPRMRPEQRSVIDLPSWAQSSSGVKSKTIHIKKEK